MIAFGTNAATGLSVVPAADGPPQPRTTPDSKKYDRSQRWPEFLPGAKAVLFCTSTQQIALDVLKTGERRDLTQGGVRPHYAPTGHLLYTQGGTLMAVPFDPGRVQAMDVAAPIVEGVTQSSSGAAQ